MWSKDKKAGVSATGAGMATAPPCPGVVSAGAVLQCSLAMGGEGVLSQHALLHQHQPFAASHKAMHSEVLVLREICAAGLTELNTRS